MLVIPDVLKTQNHYFFNMFWGSAVSLPKGFLTNFRALFEPQEGPKSAPRDPEIAPTWGQDRPKRARKGPRHHFWPPEGGDLKTPPHIRIVQIHPRQAPKCPRPSKLQNDSPAGSKMTPYFGKRGDAFGTCYIRAGGEARSAMNCLKKRYHTMEYF